MLIALSLISSLASLFEEEIFELTRNSINVKFLFTTELGIELLIVFKSSFANKCNLP